MKPPIDNLMWIEELLPPGYDCMPKQGGMAYYLDMKLVLILVERRGLYEHKGVRYPFELWNGCIIPVEKKAQNAFFLKYLFLENHPANKDWLYIPAESENFEEEVKLLIREIARGNPLLGLAVKQSELSRSEKSSELPPKKVRKKARTDKKGENAFLLSVAKKQRSSS
ncbi:MAG: hypothetical protein OM95_14835 [Bdellovibrio sp. ArHS]|uniref:hypothetical protein n=1 Tax=Bdellovibrio sp. ArHS TaxID=1569284 RepID=UPI000583D060|nr:hypothetical protein [Bdellovibrio sp. ArHS]KHD87372.1 MAG: hypothetical protein OM95_14835 [Bdellovibrio sp. ArHS]